MKNRITYCDNNKAFMYDTSSFYKKRLTDYPILYSFHNILKYLKGKDVLDVGCGTGHYLKFFGKSSIGLDCSEPNISSLRKKGFKGEIFDVNCGLSKFKNNSFEAVFLSHILEHVDNPIFLLRESYRILKRNGIIVLGLPLEFSLVRALGDKYYKDHPYHLYSFSEENIRYLCRKVGYGAEIELVYEFPLIQRLNLTKLSGILNFILTGRIKSVLASSYWIIFKKC